MKMQSFFPNAQKMLPWQPVWGQIGETAKVAYPSFIPHIVYVFQNVLEDRNSDAKRLNDNHSSTLRMGGARILT